MAIILLEQPEPNHFQCVFWIDVPVAKRPYYADSAKTSSYKLASALEVASLRDGSVVEIAEPMNFPPGMPMAIKQNQLEARLTTLQAEMNASGNNSPLGRYGTRYNGTAWIPGGLS